MSGNRLHTASLALFTCLAALLSAEPALACSVCVGDPSSPLTHGVQAGMLALLGVTALVLTGLASLLLFWVRRAAQLRAQVGAAKEAG
jgi:hypothetical protein